MEKNNTLHALFESVKSKFEHLSNADDRLDAKAGTLMGFEVTLIIGYLSFVINNLEGVSLWLGVCGLMLLLASSILLLAVNMPKDYTSICVNFRTIGSILKSQTMTCYCSLSVMLSTPLQKTVRL